MQRKTLFWTLGVAIALAAITNVILLKERGPLSMQITGVKTRPITKDEAEAGVIMKADEQNVLRCPETPAREVNILGSVKPPAAKRFWGYEYSDDEVRRKQENIHPIFNGKFFISEGELLVNPEYGEINTLRKISGGKRYYFMSEIDLHFSCATGLQPVFSCGNGVVEGEQKVGGNVTHAAEKCDDGNSDNTDGCRNNCTTPAVCGDGAVEDDEKCDDGNTASGDGCNASCTREEGYACTGTPSACTALPTVELTKVSSFGGGNALFISGRYAYTPYISVFDIADPTSPKEVGVLKSKTGIPDIQNPTDVYVDGNFAYVTSLGGLTIISVSNPHEPRVVGHFRDDTKMGRLLSVHVSGKHAYVLSGPSVSQRTGRLNVLDISDPRNPTLVGAYTQLADPLSLAVSGNHAYIGAAGLNNFPGLLIFDIATPTNPTKIAELKDKVYGGVGSLLYNVNSVAIKGKGIFL